MCECEQRSLQVSRRNLLRSSSVLALAVPLLCCVPPPTAQARVARPSTATTELNGLPVQAREEWGADLPPTGSLERERPEDVRFLLVHHTASSNTYNEADVARLIRGFYAAHTGSEKNWPDVAYNFFVDRYGKIWEGREGSLTAPVKGDATGGSQGFAMLCCFIGNHQEEPPSPDARQAMIQLLAALADIYAIDTAPGATTSFISRGSNRWPRGTLVTTTTIAGHRDMSRTVCPGDQAYDVVRTSFPAEVSRLRVARPAITPSSELADPMQDLAPAPAAGTAPGSPMTADVNSWSTTTALSGGAAVAAALAFLAITARRAVNRSRTDAPNEAVFCRPRPDATQTADPGFVWRDNADGHGFVYEHRRPWTDSADSVHDSAREPTVPSAGHNNILASERRDRED